jgi:peptidoglycan/LPS O-acetylase OafA/YrhL
VAQSTLTKIKSSAAAVQHQAKIKRRDIQGLRAIAVLAVVFDHLLHWPSGGFVGVDVFFVISGFLITGLLLREHDKTGTISFSGFYKRRIRRIMPAAVAVLAVSASLSFLLFNKARADQTLLDGVWGFFFSANWRFAAIGTDYFQANGPVSPLQHFWSLAVEEQFYFVWPWLMLLIFWLGGRSTKWDRDKAHRAIAIAMITITTLSFAWAMFESAASPTMAYFSTFSRTWELGIGALLAVFVPLLKRLPAVVRPSLAWAGIAGIVWGIFAINADMQFPAPWAVVPVLATALVIAAGTGAEPRFIWPLTNPVTDYIGNISYSLYLWHFPVIILLGSLVQETSPAFAPTALVMMFGLSALSYRCVEQKALKSLWLNDSREAKIGRNRRQHTRLEIKKSTQLAGLAVLAVVAFAVAGIALTATPKSQAQTLPAPTALSTPTKGAKAETLVSLRAKVISSSLTATEWPQLTPDVGELATKGREPVNCQFDLPDAPPTHQEVLENCVNGDKNATKTAVVLGDSYSAALSAGIVHALTPKGWKVIILTKNLCPAINISITTDAGAPYDSCSDFHKFTASEVAELAPDMVVLTEWHGYVNGRLASGADGQQGTGEWRTALRDSVTALAKSAEDVVVVSPPPHGANLQECATPLSRPSDCVTPIAGSYIEYVASEKSVIASLGNAATRYIPMQDWFCTQGKCPPFIGKNPIYTDGGHLTTAAAKAAAPLLAEALVGKG